jgi:membrane protein implicated in regulation of membrane protease activity
MFAAALALLIAERATWPSYLAFVLLAVALIAVVWHNQRVRRRAREGSARESDEPEEPT